MCNRHKFEKGKPTWNTGLTKELDKRLIRSEEYKQSIRGKGNSFYGRKHTEESKRKIKENHIYLKGKDHASFGKHIWKNKNHPRGMLGKKGYWTGRKRDDATIDKIRKSNLGRKASYETIKKMKIAHKNNWENLEFIEKWKKGMIRFKENVVYPTTPESILIGLIKKNNLLYEYVGDGKFWINKFNPDFISQTEKLIIEVFGDYWHNRDDIKKRDSERINAYSKGGYRTLIIWEHELIELKKQLIEEQIIIDKIKDKEGYYFIPEVEKNEFL